MLVAYEKINRDEEHKPWLSADKQASKAMTQIPIDDDEKAMVFKQKPL